MLKEVARPRFGCVARQRCCELRPWMKAEPTMKIGGMWVCAVLKSIGFPWVFYFLFFNFKIFTFLFIQFFFNQFFLNQFFIYLVFFSSSNQCIKGKMVIMAKIYIFLYEWLKFTFLLSKWPYVFINRVDLISVYASHVDHVIPYFKVLFSCQSTQHEYHL